MCKGSFPLERQGIVALPKIPQRELVTEFLPTQHISEEILTEHFSAMFQNFLTQLTAKNYNALEKFTEKRFLKQLTERQGDLNKFQLRYTPNSLDEVSSSSYMIDQMLVKGVRQNRDENDLNHDYVYVDNLENRGLRFYLHKYFLGFHPYYIQTENEEYFKRSALPKNGEVDG